MCKIVAYVLLSIALVAHTLVPAKASEITIAVRKDTPPFVWKDKHSGEHLGFFWDVCTEAAQRAGYKFNVQEITASDRDFFLETAQLQNLDTTMVLLCDPTTITLKRLRRFTEDLTEDGQSKLTFSPIIFVANGTYFFQGNETKRSKAWGKVPAVTSKTPDCDALLGWLDQNKLWEYAGDEPPPYEPREDKTGSATNGMLVEYLKNTLSFTLRPKKQKPRKTYEVWGYVVGTTAGEAVVDKRITSHDGNLICTDSYVSHAKAAEAFCEGRLDRYYGDSDILHASIEQVSLEKSCASDPKEHKSAGTYEPYALVVSRAIGAPVTLALYEMFEDGTMKRLFAGHFPEAQMSQPLNTLFQINSIPRGEPNSNRNAPSQTTDPG